MLPSTILRLRSVPTYHDLERSMISQIAVGRSDIFLADAMAPVRRRGV